jgi:hypothetical protein
MPTADVKVLFIGKTWEVPYPTVRLEPNSRSLFATLATFRPDVIVTCGPVPASLNLAPFEIRKRWIHLDSGLGHEAVVQAVEACYQGWLWGHPGEAAQPLMSVYTATYDTGDCLRDTYHSLRQQTYPNWEWVVVDDGSGDGTWERLLEIAAEDFRVRPIRVNHLGRIGAVKRLATQAALGPYLVELDHDDLLTGDALEAVKQAFETDPETGMVYSNFAEFFQDGRSHRYEGAFWEHRYRETEYQGRRYQECLAPDIYDRFGPAYTDQFAYFLTVGPNHVRAFRSSCARNAGTSTACSTSTGSRTRAATPRSCATRPSRTTWNWAGATMPRRSRKPTIETRPFFEGREELGNLKPKLTSCVQNNECTNG